jgi:hypothetical protein
MEHICLLVLDVVRVSLGAYMTDVFGQILKSSIIHESTSLPMNTQLVDLALKTP